MQNSLMIRKGANKKYIQNCKPKIFLGFKDLLKLWKIKKL